METQEQILKEQRLKIETLRYRILLRYYELLLTLDVMTQPNEVKTLMGYINTLERYAKKRRDIPSRSRCVAHRHRRLFKSRLCPLSETKRK